MLNLRGLGADEVSLGSNAVSVLFLRGLGPDEGVLLSSNAMRKKGFSLEPRRISINSRTYILYQGLTLGRCFVSCLTHCVHPPAPLHEFPVPLNLQFFSQLQSSPKKISSDRLRCFLLFRRLEDICNHYSPFVIFYNKLS